MTLTYNAVQAWLVERLRDTASWHRMKTEEYPEDARNLRSARALDAAALYVETFEFPQRALVGTPLQHPVPKGLVAIFRLAEVEEPLGQWTRILWGQQTVRTAARFCFDHSTEQPTTETVDHLLENIAVALRDDLRAPDDTESDDEPREPNDRPSQPLLHQLREDALDSQILSLLRDLRELLNRRLPA